MTTAFEKVGSLMESAVAWPERLKHPLMFATNHRTGSAALRNILRQEIGPDAVFAYTVIDSRTGKVLYTYENFFRIGEGKPPPDLLRAFLLWRSPAHTRGLHILHDSA